MSVESSSAPRAEGARIEESGFGRKAGGPVAWLEDRTGGARALKPFIRKVFPDHWSFMLGEIALWSFVVLLLTGVFLTLWFDPSATETVYDGSYAPLRGVEMSAAYESTLNISFDIRGGLLMRQIHHWSAMLFLAAMLIHMLRVFFTGAYRKPRELNWLLGVGLFAVGLLEGFAGYSLPDDLLSGTGLRIADGIVRSIPIVGSYLEFFLFGGEFPGDAVIPRLYILHVLLLPAVLLALVGGHLILTFFHKHTHWAGPGRTEKNVVGYPFLPVYVAKTSGFFFIVFGVTALMGALIQINAIWNYGPYDPSQVSAGAQPDWYLGWLEGALRIMPGTEWTIFGWTFSWNVFVPSVIVPGILFTVLALYPFVEQWLTGDRRTHHVLERPRNNPTRTAFGVAGITWYGILWAAGGNDVLAVTFHLDIFAITWAARILVFVGPVVAFLVTKRICIGLQRRDAEQVLHGYETGIIERSPDGGYTERHAALSGERAYELTAHERPEVEGMPEDVDDNGVRAPQSRKAKVRARLSRFAYGDVVEKPTREEFESDVEHRAEIETSDDEFSGVSETGVPRSD
ncbi:cytochrome bc1 complex cytochrome b subunit [Solicola gregarius]|uniref:Cytochrome bc1 complex cytochrome b subunit n=1 Tax=Solicola gregarius TaxID=2908642 RepID=A0AA46TM19_9ACTN|nr:ubiquinol-cytochrome c reductase cytochrome b subunit [Solicola gregarius]UYM07750.1 ubiquinol-cytochrome c reductase cytochrome b subunit [Solicola gregarius]